MLLHNLNYIIYSKKEGPSICYVNKAPEKISKEDFGSIEIKTLGILRALPMYDGSTVFVNDEAVAFCTESTVHFYDTSVLCRVDARELMAEEDYNSAPQLTFEQLMHDHDYTDSIFEL